MRPRGRDSSSSGSKDKCKKWKGHLYHKKIWGLAALYGGEPEQYADFAEKTGDKRPMEAFEQWADENGISKEEFRRRFTDFRCKKLSGFFGKEPQYYKEFVEANIKLPQREMMEKLYESGLEQRENKRKCWWGGRKFDFNNSQPAEEEKAEKKKEEGVEKKEKKEKSHKKKERSSSEK